MEFLIFAMAWAKKNANETEKAVIDKLYTAYADYLRDEINSDRSELGLPPLDWDKEEKNFRERNSHILN